MKNRTLAFSALFAIAALAVPTLPTIADNPPGQAPVDAQPVPLPPAPVNGTVSPATAPLPNVDPSTANIAARLSTTLYPTLIPTDTELQSDIQAGRQMGSQGKDVVDVLNIGSKPFAFRPGGLLKQLRRPVGIVYFITPGIEARWRGFLETKMLATTDAQQADFETVRDHVIAPARSFTFIVEFDNLVKDSSDGSVPEDISDAAQKVQGTRFVLSDDKGTNYDPITAPTAPLLVSRRQFFEAIADSPDAVVAATSTDDLPKTESAPPWSGLVKKRNGFNDISAFYLVSFNAFNGDGTARAGRDTQFLTLHILGPDGQRWVSYNTNSLP